MNISRFLPALLLLPTGIQAQQNRQNEDADPKRPNILCITCEDISPMIHCFGDSVAVTPHLDHFSEVAIRYSNLHTSVGVSAPSRYSLITGRYPSSDCSNHMRTCARNNPKGIPPYNIIVAPEVRCYTEMLREKGYFCTNNPKTDYQFNVPFAAWDECGKEAHWKHRPEGAPFFAIFNLNVTHESRTWVRTNEKLSVNPQDIQVPPYYPDTPTVRHDMAVVYSNITEMDRQFQALYDELVEAGELENTIIIWYSDNGGPLPHHKREIYDRGTKVPFMISFPDHYLGGTIVDDLVAFVDIPPTILSLVGIKPPHYMQGQAFLGKYKASKKRDYVYGARDRMDDKIDKQGYIRDEHFRYVKNYRPGTPDYLDITYRLNMPMMNEILEMHEKGQLNEIQASFFDLKRPIEEFYDLDQDPLELQNAIDDEKYAKEIARLRKHYDRWIKKYNQNWFIPEKEYRKRILPDGTQPQVGIPTMKKKKNTIILETNTPGATISYRRIGSKSLIWEIYQHPIKFAPGESIEVIASRIGYINSDKITYYL